MTYIAQQTQGAGVFGYSYGWIDYVVPAGYVQGSGLTLNIDCVSAGDPQTFFVTAVTVNDGSTTGGSLTAAPQGTRNGYSTIAPGQNLLTYFPATVAHQQVTAPSGRATVTGYIGGSNLTLDASYGSFNKPNGIAVFDGAMIGEPAGSGASQVSVNPPDPATQYWIAGYQGAFVGFPTYFEGGCVLGAGPANGTKSFKAGDTISLVFCCAQNTFRQVKIFSVEVDAGAGGTSMLDLTTMWQCNDEGGDTDSPPYGDPQPIGTNPITSGVGEFKYWYLVGAPGAALTTQGQIF